MRYSDKIGKQLRSIRESKGYSQEYVAEMLDTCQSVYANLESGKSSMSVDRMLKICDILDTDVHHLLDQAGKTNAEKNLPANNYSFPGNGSSYEIQQLYETRIRELRSEIDFLRELVRQQRPVDNT